MRVHHRLAALMLLGLTALPPVGRAHAAGPWKGQVVDGETGTPIEGVVVLVYWTKHTRSLGGWAGGEFVDAEEVLTGPDGAFRIPARFMVNLLPWHKIQREWVVHKNGYGQWDFRRTVPVDGPLDARLAEGRALWKQFEREGVVIELPPLHTRKERYDFYGRNSLLPIVPPERTPRLREADAAERAYLGLDHPITSPGR